MRLAVPANEVAGYRAADISNVPKPLPNPGLDPGPISPDPIRFHLHAPLDNHPRTIAFCHRRFVMTMSYGAPHQPPESTTWEMSLRSRERSLRRKHRRRGTPTSPKIHRHNFGPDELGKRAYYFQMSMTGVRRRVIGSYRKRSTAIQSIDVLRRSVRDGFCNVKMETEWILPRALVRNAPHSPLIFG